MWLDQYGNWRTDGMDKISNVVFRPERFHGIELGTPSYAEYPAPGPSIGYGTPGSPPPNMEAFVGDYHGTGFVDPIRGIGL